MNPHRAWHRKTRFPADAATVSDIIPLALSDRVRFDQILALYGRGPDEVQALMRREPKRGSCLAWRKRFRKFSERRETYK